MTIHIDFFSYSDKGQKSQRDTEIQRYREAEKSRKNCGFIIKQSKWPPPIRTIVSDV